MKWSEFNESIRRRQQQRQLALKYRLPELAVRLAMFRVAYREIKWVLLINLTEMFRYSDFFSFCLFSSFLSLSLCFT